MVYEWFDYVKSKYHNKIHGYVIMPNHIHVLMYISDKSAKTSVLIQNAKRFIGHAILNYLREDKKIALLKKFEIGPNKKKAEHEIWQTRYDSLLIHKLFLQKLNYIHNNPCQEKWHLAENPEDYRYSSASNYINGNGYYKVDIIDF